MAYRIIFKDKILRQYIIFDFIHKFTIKTVDCTTEEGQQEFCKLFSFRKLVALNKLYNTQLLILKFKKEITIHKSHLNTLFENFDERAKRLFAGFLSLTFQSINKNELASICCLSSKTILKGEREILMGSCLSKKRIRASGGGRKTKIQEYDNFLTKLNSLTEDHIAGDPINSRKWVRRSLTYFKIELEKENIKASRSTIRKYFKSLKISLKVNKKSIATKQFQDRDKQFRQINRFKKSFLKSGNPVISIDTKKKEQLGLFRVPGMSWKKDPVSVYDHDFRNLATGYIIPFGIYDLKENCADIYCGTSSETSKFIVEMILHWWEEIGQFLYPSKNKLLILSDAGGANSYRRYGWKIELQNQFSSKFGIQITVCHYPPGCSKWNPIEHKVFSFISINWSGRVLDSVETALNLINSTKTKSGLTVRSHYFEKKYEKGVKYTEDQKRQINIQHTLNLPLLTYTIFP
jgi:hypothetical protein